MTNRQILVILAMFCVMSLFAAGASANATIGIGDGSGHVIIPITVAGATNVGSVDVTLTYDASIVTVRGVTGGEMDSEFWNIEDNGAGEIRIGAYQASNPGLNGDFVLVNVEFGSVADSGSCPLEISVTTFKDATPDGTPMQYDVSSGTYTATSDGNNGGGYYNGDNGDNGDDVNVTPTVTPTTTPTTSPTASPTKVLPDEDPIDDAVSNWGFLAVFVIAGILLIAYLLLRGKGDK